MKKKGEKTTPQRPILRVCWNPTTESTALHRLPLDGTGLLSLRGANNATVSVLAGLEAEGRVVDRVETEEEEE